MLFRVTVYAGPSETDDRDPSVKVHEMSTGTIDETLRMIGMEYRGADYFPTRQVVITIDPVTTDDRNFQTAKRKVEEAHLLIEEASGLLS